MARALLGARLVRVLDDASRLSGIIVETEAYLGVKDRACHSYGGRRTPRVEAMYGKPGLAYVFFTYGMHHCFNVVCGRKGEPVAVLVRALEPVEGLDVMRRLRGRRCEDRELCSGPARLCMALGITLRDNGVDLVSDPNLFIEHDSTRTVPADCVVAGPRIGVQYAAQGGWSEAPLRFYVGGNPHVSARG